MRRRDVAMWRACVATVASVAMTAGCQTFVAPTHFRPFHAAEPFGVEFLHGGRVAQMQLKDGSRVQALALRITTISARANLRALADYRAKVLVSGRRLVGDPTEGVLPFFLPYDPQLDLERELYEWKAHFEGRRVDTEEQSFFADLPDSLNTAPVLLACESQPGEAWCLSPAQTYTLFLRTTNPFELRDNATAHTFLVGRRSGTISVIGGLAFFFGLYMFTIG